MLNSYTDILDDNIFLAGAFFHLTLAESQYHYSQNTLENSSCVNPNGEWIKAARVVMA